MPIGASGTKLIVIRGNSGSGKSTVARMVRGRSRRKTALLEQDYIRRSILREGDVRGFANVAALIMQMATFGLDRGYDVILEGILSFNRYGPMLRELIELCPDHYVYYMEIRFEETLRRHFTKPNATEFGAKEMQGWYQCRDVTDFEGETIIDESYSPDRTVDLIVRCAGL